MGQYLREFCPEVNAKRHTHTHTCKTSHQNAGKNHHLTVCNKSFENVAMFKYLGAKLKIRFAFTNLREE